MLFGIRTIPAGERVAVWNAKGEVALVEETIAFTSAVVGQSIGMLNLPSGAVPVALVRGARVLLPTADVILQAGDRLIALARGRLSSKLTKRVDPEDVVQSAYRSFFAGVRDGRYDPQRGGDLWRLLVVITLHKLSHQLRRNLSAKRSVDREYSFGSEESL